MISTTKSATVPARAVLTAAMATNERLGHENLGFLSESHGFMPVEPPLLSLPASHAAWDEAAAQLPEWFRTLTLRERLDRLPLLPAGVDDLDDIYLQRASVIFSIFAHAYHYVDPEPPEHMPESVLRPWREISERLERPAPYLSFADMNVYNWRLRDPRRADDIVVENLQLLVPILGNEDERRFQMTPVEMSAAFTPIVGSVVRAQEAVVRDDVRALKRELMLISETLHGLTFNSFAKVDPNPFSPTYVNPVVWGKTVAPLATPYQSDPPPAPSGTAIPVFQLTDGFFGRSRYASTIGKETARARRWFPKHWREFLEAAEAISVPAYVERHADRALQGIFHECERAYLGENGLLARHRLKTFGYLDLSFKAGRSKTLGGFSGSFDDRPWDRMDTELGLAKAERVRGAPEGCQRGVVEWVDVVSGAAAVPVARVVLDVKGSGLRYRAGARCSVLPENAAALVDKTLRSLRARGDEPVQLDAAWQRAISQRDGYEHARVLSLRSLLTFGRIRPVTRAAAKALLRMSHNEALRRIVEARAEDQWELWDLLELLSEAGFKPAKLWKALPGERENICRVVVPESFRMYSISSAMEDPSAESAERLHLTVGGMRYQTEDGENTRAASRSGSGSSFLLASATGGRRLTVKVVTPARFALPADERRPIVMFAGGTGISPFLGLLEARLGQASAAESWLFFGTRTRAELYGEDELARAVDAGKLQLRVAFSREDVRAASVMDDDNGGDGRARVRFVSGRRCHIDELMLEEANARRLWDLLRDVDDGGLGAHVYVCGRTGFAAAVESALEAIIARYGADDDASRPPSELLFRLNGEGRYAQEIYTTYAGPQAAQTTSYTASDVVLRNDDDNGYWMVIDGRVYDVGRFAKLHPGGDKIMRSYSGMDATEAYRRVQHDANPEVDAMLGLYEIGAVRRLDLGRGWCTAVSPSGVRVVTTKEAYRAWIALLYRAVEMQNALANDFAARHEPVTHDESPSSLRLSPYKERMLFQTHRRFRGEYVGGLTGVRLEHLWAITAGLHSDRHDVRALRQRLDALFASERARDVDGLEAEIAATLQRSTRLGASVDEATRAWLTASVSALERLDRRLIHDLKLAFREGVCVFERRESDTFAHGADDLFAALLRVPALVSSYLDEVAALDQQQPAGGLA